MAFLVVVHLQPTFKSHMAEILGRVSHMPVIEANEGMAVEPNKVFLIPPNKSMTLMGGKLSLQARPSHGLHMPIDHLFRSLARAQRNRAIGIILSGEGTDGTLGFQAMKAEGGVTFAQDEKSAKHDSMPRSAVHDGGVDYVLPPPEIARELMRLNSHPYAAIAVPTTTTTGSGEAIQQLLALLRAQTEVDFTHYKRSTIHRRIQRRMALRGLERIEDYLKLVRDDKSELDNLYQDLLIRVTQFFRDAESYEVLKQKVFPELADKHKNGDSIRVWVAGCSTGEEVYSLAISLLEYLGPLPDAIPIKILATDLNENALERARAGLYIDNIVVDVSPERLRRYFNRVDSHYQISKSVRDLCVFSRHNLSVDPPFSRLDLVSCRNLLIYLDNALQRRVLPVLHYALKPDGFLFLGSSENVGPFNDMFTSVDPKHRIFRRAAVAGQMPLEFGPFVSPQGRAHRIGHTDEGPLWSALDVQREADRIVLNRYAPVGVVIDEGMTVIQFRGRTVPYLEPAPGMANLDLLRMLREGLLADVRATIMQAKAENGAVAREGLAVSDNGKTRTVKLEVIPFKVPPAGSRFFLVLFQDQSTAAAPPATPAHAPPSATEQMVVQLQQETTALREYLQSVIEDRESTNEELKSANEEILSANEELQSTNEELQTAKEEAQSANEELATVNEELRHRNVELARVNNDLVNLLSGVNIPIVMVSRDLRIRRFTPLAEKAFNLIATDMGRPISDLKPNLQGIDLASLISHVIDSLTPIDRQVQGGDGKWFSLRVRPYVTLENKIDGASVVLIDIDALKQGT
jgi:two-component system CheB/CheR fusion protein